jgi:hypothetical protein
MDCAQIKNLMSAYLDNVLDATNAKLLEQHLAACPTCAAELQALRSTLAALGSLQKLAAPADFLDRVHLRLEQPSGVRRFLHALLFPWRVKLPLGLAGAVATALLVVLTYQQMKTTKGPMPAPTVLPVAPAARAPSQPAPVAHEKPAAVPSLLAEADRDGAQRPRQDERPVVLALLLKSTPDRAALTAQTDANRQKQDSPGKESQAEPSSSLATQKAGPTGSALAPPAPRSAAPAGGEMRSARIPTESAEQAPREAESTHRAGRRPEAKSKATGAEELQRRAQPDDSPRGDYALRPGAIDQAKAGARGQGTQGALQGAPLPLRPADEALGQIRELVKNSGGIIVSEDHPVDPRQPPSLLAQIPGGNYTAFVEQLALLGKLQEPLPKVLTANHTTSIRVHIKLVFAP